MRKRNIDCNLRAALEKHTTEQLDLRLQTELRKDNPSEDLVMAIMDILQERESDLPAEITDTVLESWGNFKNQCDDEYEPKTNNIWKMLTSVAACVLVLLLLSMTVPKALGAENVFQLIAQWTETVFSFSQGNNDLEEYIYQTDHPGLQQIYDAVTELGVTEPVVPMWVPEGFELEDLEVVDQNAYKRIYARLLSDSQRIVLSFDIHMGDYAQNYAKDENSISTVEIEGITYYILSNDGEWTVTWLRDKVECSICLNCQEDAVYKILYSIHGLEETQ